MSRRLTKRDLALSLYAAGRTVEEIADTLEITREFVIGAVSLTNAPDLYTTAIGQNDYARMFRGVLRFKDVHAAQESVARLDELWRGFADAGDVRGMHQAQIVALIGKNRSEGIGKETCARLFGEWLAGHMWTPTGGGV